MISVQPIKLVSYIGLKRNKTPKVLRRLFYLSWEDALWDLLDKKRIPKKSYILLPDFWCEDVVINIKNHGYRVIYYSVSKDLIVSENKFLEKINKYSPQVIVVFHPIGIKSNLLKDRRWIDTLPDGVLLIEDSVHRIVNPNNIKIFRKNHFVIDSLRKVVPLQGSNIYGRVEDLDYSSPHLFQSFSYSLKVHAFWFLMIVLWNLGLNNLAEKYMKRGYDLIGDSKIPASGLFIFKFLFEFINYDKIYKIKRKQIEIYNKYLKSDARFEKIDWSEMRGYPIIHHNEIADRVLKYLRSQNLTVRFELSDSLWSQAQKIIYLPLGPYLRDVEIKDIATLVLKSFEHE